MAAPPIAGGERFVVTSQLSPPARRIILSLLVGTTMLLPLGYQLYVIAMILVGKQPDTPF